jgi:hypothetical protein
MPHGASESKGKRMGTFQNNEVPTQERDHKIPGFAVKIPRLLGVALRDGTLHQG